MYPKTQQSTSIHRLRYLLPLLVLVLSVLPLRAQMQYGDFKFNLAGNLGYGYSGSFGTNVSGHGQNLVGIGYLTGSYYDPNFISFNVRPYYDRNQSNSLSQIVSHDNGVDSGIDFFRGSHFPGNVTFTKTFNSVGEAGIPGAAGLVTDGSSQSFQVSWSELLPGLPPVYFTFMDQGNNYTAIGANGENHTTTKLFTLNSNYRLAGFYLSGGMTHSGQTYDFPDYFGFENLSGSGGSTTYYASAQHDLPLHGNSTLSWSRTNYGSDFGTEQNGSSTTTGLGLGFVPWRRLQLTTGLNYTTNATGALEQSLVTQGALPILYTPQNSRSLQFNSRATLWITRGLSVNGNYSQSSVSFAGREFSNTQYGGSLNYRYSQRLLGMLYFSLGVVDTATKLGNTNLGLIGNVGLSRKVKGWETSADFGYSQDVQTLYGIDAASTISYGGSVRRKINDDTYWGGTFRANHTALVRLPGESSGSEAYSTSISWKRYSAAATYADSRGTSVLTPNGVLTPTPIAPIITNDFVFFNARSFGVGGSAGFRNRLRVGGNYSRVHSSTDSPFTNTINRAEIYNLRTEYRVRKLSFIGGFTRVDQGINLSNNGIPTVVNSFYMSISRWFNVF